MVAKQCADEFYCQNVTNEEIVFRDQILENRDNNILRLIFADWLEEHPTTERIGFAAFIRAQFQDPEHGGITSVRSTFKKPYLFHRRNARFIAKCPSWAEWVEYQGGFAKIIRCNSWCILWNEDFFQSNPLQTIFFSDLRHCAIRISNDKLEPNQPLRLRAQCFRNMNWIDRSIDLDYCKNLFMGIWSAVMNFWIFDDVVSEKILEVARYRLEQNRQNKGVRSDFKQDS